MHLLVGKQCVCILGGRKSRAAYYFILLYVCNSKNYHIFCTYKMFCFIANFDSFINCIYIPVATVTAAGLCCFFSSWAVYFFIIFQHVNIVYLCWWHLANICRKARLVWLVFQFVYIIVNLKLRWYRKHTKK